MKQIVTKAIVLRRINYQEADRIITFLTSDNGKITVMGKGVRRASSKLAGSIELFGTSQITYLPGRGDMGTLVSARLINNFSNIVKDLKKTQLGYEILKLINKSIESDSVDESLFELVESALDSLNKSTVSVELTKFWFSIQFLTLMGHTPNLDVATDVSDKFIFDIDKMSFIPDDDGNYDKNNIKLLRLSLVNNPEQLSKIKDLDKIIEKNLALTQMMLIDAGFNPI
jgi:DNA repair protein RecO (recombination protein O)